MHAVILRSASPPRYNAAPGATYSSGVAPGLAVWLEKYAEISNMS